MIAASTCTKIMFCENVTYLVFALSASNISCQSTNYQIRIPTIDRYFTIWFDHRCGLRGNIVTSQPAGPGSIPCRVNFLIEVFSRVFPGPKTNVRIFGPHSSPVVAIIYHPNHNIIRLRSATVSNLSCSTWPSLINKQKTNNMVDSHLIAMYYWT